MFRDQRGNAVLLHLFDSFRFQIELANFDLEFEMFCGIITLFLFSQVTRILKRDRVLAKMILFLPVE